MHWPLWLPLCLCLGGCFGDDNRDAASPIGPGISVHCAAASPRPTGVGDTTIRVNCPNDP